MNFKFTSQSLDEKRTVVFMSHESENPIVPYFARSLDKEADGTIAKAFNENNFRGEENKNLTISMPQSTKISRIIFQGLGPQDTLNRERLLEAGGALARALTKEYRCEINLLEFQIKSFSPEEIANDLALGIMMKSWSFRRYKTASEANNISCSDVSKLEEVSFVVPNPTKAEDLFVNTRAIEEGISLSRNLSMEPPNILYPRSMALILKDLERFGVLVSILEKEKIEELGMGALLGVSRGSSRDPQVVIMEWNGNPNTNEVIAFVGKGVTFDSGGLNLKSWSGMKEMKYDMTGAATVSGLIRTLARRKSQVNAVGIVGLVENMPSGTSQRPGDIVRTMSGKTVEVLNTDAEGRLVLADVLWYAVEFYKPKLVIDLATLTGAISVALGDYYAGLFSNSEDFSKKLIKTGLEVGEKVWLLPLSKYYDKMLEGRISDLQNISDLQGAGSILAAQFLQNFVKNTPWIHLDIAGVAWTERNRPLYDKGPTGFGVHLLNRFVQSYFE